MTRQKNMIILIKTTSTKHHKHIQQFCNQIAYAELETASENKRANQLRQDVKSIICRPNYDVSQKNKNQLQELIQIAWKEHRETWAIPESEQIKVSFPDNIKDAWQHGQAYYIFTGTVSSSRVIRF